MDLNPNPKKNPKTGKIEFFEQKKLTNSQH